MTAYKEALLDTNCFSFKLFPKTSLVIDSCATVGTSDLLSSWITHFQRPSGLDPSAVSGSPGHRRKINDPDSDKDASIAVSDLELCHPFSNLGQMQMQRVCAAPAASATAAAPDPTQSDLVSPFGTRSVPQLRAKASTKHPK